jgi:hypothetical protein
VSGRAFNRVHGAFHSLGQNVRPGHNASCPVPSHGQGRGDLHPSLSISVAGDGIGLKCHAGCSLDEITAALGLKVAELFDDYDPDRLAKRIEKVRRDHAENDASHARVKQRSNGATVQPSTQVQDRAKGKGSGNDEPRREHEIEQLLRAFEDGSLDADLPPIEMPPLPLDSSSAMNRIAGLVARIVALQVWADMDRPYEVWLAYRWAAKCIRLPEPTTYRAWKRLHEAGWLVLLHETERLPHLPRGTYVFGVAGLLAEDAESASAALPAEAGRVEADDAGRVDERQEVGEHTAVGVAVADDGREVLERCDGLGAALAQAAGRHVVEATGVTGGGPRSAILGDQDWFT